MQLLVAHQVLIGAAIALATLFGVRALGIWGREGSPQNLMLGLLALGIAAGLGLYFRKVRAKWLESKKRS